MNLIDIFTMETVKKRGGKKGLPKGVSGNPKGKPVGTKNKITAELKEKMSNFLIGNFDEFIKDVRAVVDPGNRAKIYLEAYKTVMPKPRDEEEVEEEKKISEEFMRRLFPDRYKDSE